MRAAERNDLIVSWLTISVAFSILVSRNFLNIVSFALALPISLIVVGTGFIFHELAHRQVAKHFGAHAEYRAWQIGLIFALASSFLGFIFAAPGAVYIYGNINIKQNGIISVAGPLTNIVIALGFFILAAANINSWTNSLGHLGAQINLLLALFNMIPFRPLDGSKVFAWKPVVWGATVAVAFFGFLLVGFI